MNRTSSRLQARVAALLVAALACAFALALAGCGSSGGAPASSAASEGGSGSAASESASAEASGGSAASESASAEASDDAASSEGAQASTITFTDSAGRTVEVPAEISKVAVSGPISQMCMLTFAPDKMVGLSNELSDAELKYVGEQYGALPVYGQIYGGKGDFNKEAVAAAGPQLILDIGEAKDSIVADMDEIQEATGIPCVHIEASYDTYAQAYDLLGELLGEPDRAAELSAYCTQALEDTLAALESVPEDERVQVAYLLGDSGLNAMAKGSFQGTVVDLVSNNVAELENPGGSGLGSEVSFEQIALWDPQMIVFGPGSVYASAADDETWSTLTAIQEGNYYEVPGEPYNWLSSPPGINQVLGLQWFARLCYPNAFDDSIADVAKDYYSTLYGYSLTDDECDALIANSVPRT